MDAEQLMRTIRPWVGEAVPGAVVGVLQGTDVSLGAIGTTEPDGTGAMPVDAVMRISSTTKPMVAAVTLLLVQEGVLALDDAVEEYVPELTGRRVLRRLDGPLEDTVPARRPVTVEDLLTMRLGFGFVVEGECPAAEAGAAAGLGFGPPDPAGMPAPDHWVARLAALPLLEQPGTVWRYDMAYALLGVVLARAAGCSLDDLMRERLFGPLGMPDTGFTAPPQGLVPSFVRTGDGLALFDGASQSRWSAPPVFPDARGGLVSTAGDLLRFARMLLDGGGGLLSRELVGAMTSDRLTPEQRSGPSARAFLNGGGWGYGVGVDEGDLGRRYGWGGGLGTLWYSWPQEDTAIVLLTQVMPPSAPLFDAVIDAAEAALAR